MQTAALAHMTDRSDHSVNWFHCNSVNKKGKDRCVSALCQIWCLYCVKTTLNSISIQ